MFDIVSFLVGHSPLFHRLAYAEGQEHRTTTSSEFEQISAQLLQNGAIENAVLVYHSPIARISEAKARFGCIRNRMESIPCKGGA